MWRDSDQAAAAWRIEISFGDGDPPIRTTSEGERMRIGAIDPECVAETNELPKLTPRQALAHTWVPDTAIWESIKKRSTGQTALLTVTGHRAGRADPPVSLGRATFTTSRDPVGAPIFYRDVPLMPTETEKGSIQPLAASAVRLIKWRLRYIGEARSRVVLEKLPMCANCHSFSRDGRTLGLDLDGPQGNKGMYALARVAPEISIRNDDVIQWSTARGRLAGKIRVGFMSQVSPDGDYVVTTIDENGPLESGASSSTAVSKIPTSNYYVANFKDYRFLQVFYPTRGILAWYSRTTGVLRPLPGADNPRLVQMGAVWSPDGDSLIFARAPTIEPYAEGAAPARYANDPNERRIQYELCRIPFNKGNGGIATPIPGASANGMSNTFPKVSPDGKWIVFVQCRNGQLMRPDSRLYIVPATGGQARLMRCNTTLMNSWHSFSPNGRWLVFSSKSMSPYTQMYLTHIDSEGNDSPAILIENSTAANRAVNIPEFVNIGPDGLKDIGGPGIEYSRLVDSATYYRKQGQYEEAVATWREVLNIRPGDALAHESLGTLLLMTGHPQESATHLQLARRIRQDESLSQLRKTLEFDPGNAPAHHGIGQIMYERGEIKEAVRQWQQSLEISPDFAEAHVSIGNALYQLGRTSEALAHWRDALRLRPSDVATLCQAAWVMATSPQGSVRNGSEALSLARRADQLGDGKDPRALDALAAAYAESGRYVEAVDTARKALAQAQEGRLHELAQAIKARIALYAAASPFRETQPPSGYP
jgi:tetratricopeptide (TPR) repeat protein